MWRVEARAFAAEAKAREADAERMQAEETTALLNAELEGARNLSEGDKHTGCAQRAAVGTSAPRKSCALRCTLRAVSFVREWRCFTCCEGVSDMTA